MCNSILADYDIKELIDCYEITSEIPILDSQVQPASLDLRLGSVCYKIKSSFLSFDQDIDSLLDNFIIDKFDLTSGQVLEKGSTYLIPLLESIDFSDDHYAIFNPKSTTGRLDIFTRVIGNKTHYFDSIPNGYKGPLYLQVSPLSFNVLVTTGISLTQMRVQSGSPKDAIVSDVVSCQLEHNVIEGANVDLISSMGIPFSVDLSEGKVVGFVAKNTDSVIDLNKINYYNPDDFWDEVVPENGGIILQPESFYILHTKEDIYVPIDYSAYMMPYDVEMGEFRVHYAGFFDPGFGCKKKGRAVLEVRCREIPFHFSHGQAIGRLLYHKMANRPDNLYGEKINSNYDGQGLKLAKQFKMN